MSNATDGSAAPPAPLQQEILDLVGALRAESLGDQIFDFFAEPDFFPILQSKHSCVIKGGRGTGKTTLLRCLSYQGQNALHQSKREEISNWAFVGFFWRIHTGRVAAFAGPELAPARWTKLFAHYVNLELTDLVLEFLDWLQSNDIVVEVPSTVFEEVASSLNLGRCITLSALRLLLRRSRTTFEARLNNIADSDSSLGLSLLGAPFDLLIAHLRALEFFKGKKLFILIDEYENLLDYQQEVFNTLIKHSSSGYSFKIGVKEMGLRRYSTINPTEQLSSPADYDVISIADELAPKFDPFAEKLVTSRLERVASQHGLALPALKSIFETLSPDDEAVRLGVGVLNDAFVRQVLRESVRGDTLKAFESLSPLQKYFVASVSRGGGASPEEAILGLATRERGWARRYGNYSFALLFAIRAGKPGRHKLYSGWHSICRLANGNIRYLLELVAGMLQQHVADGYALTDQVTAEMQTDRAYEVGRKNLQELDRESDQAGSLLRLVLSLGRVFEVLAATPAGHTPEVTQFVLPSHLQSRGRPGDAERRVQDLLDEGVNSLAFVRYPGSKLQDRASIRSYDYALHPIFTALFGFSYRRKRKIEISEEEFLGFIREPKWSIGRILLRQNRDPSATPLPDQLRLFASFYE